jgi:hypothetical protein
LLRQAKWLTEHPECGAICGGFSTIDAKGKLLADLEVQGEAQEITEEMRNGVTRTHIGTFAIRAEALRVAGGSREYFDCFEDIDFQLRLGETCRVWFIPETQYYYRLHQSSSIHTTSNIKREFFDFVAHEFRKQRQTQGMDDLQRGCPPAIPEGGDKTAMNAAAHVQDMLMVSAWSEHQAGRKQQALLKGIRSVMAYPIKLEAWRSLLALAVKPVGKEPVKKLVKPGAVLEPVGKLTVTTEQQPEG